MFTRISHHPRAAETDPRSEAPQRKERSQHRLRVALAAVSVLSLGLAVSAGVAPASADGSPAHTWMPTVNYLALGDSYSAGQGSEASMAQYDPSSGSCLRFSSAFPTLFATSTPLKVALHSVACSGAGLADIVLKQSLAANAQTNLMSLTIGGNDAMFDTVLGACLKATRCQDAIGASYQIITQALPGVLAPLYRSLETAAPNAKLVVLGYPRLFGAGGCRSVSPTLTAPIRGQLDQLADLLDADIQQAASDAGATYVDVRAAFAWHGVCGATPYINGLTAELSSAFHPNAAGQQVYAAALSRSVSRLNVGVLPALSQSWHQLNVKASVGCPFSMSFAAVQGSTPLTYSVITGTLPPGLTFDASTGVISGTPTTPGRYTVTWAATNVFATASNITGWTVK